MSDKTETEDTAPVCELVPSPCVVYTKKDAEMVAEMCPIEPVKGNDNLIAVNVVVNNETLAKGQALFIVTHHTQGIRNGKPKSKIRGSWQISVPIKLHNKNDLHVFEVVSKEEAERMDALLKEARSKGPIERPMPVVSPEDLTGGPQIVT